MIATKDGVTIRGVIPEMVYAHITVSAVFQLHGLECTVTSATEPAMHGHASRHWSGAAFDYRTRHITDAVLLNRVVQEIRKALPRDDFDVVLEDDHLHVEFDPKRLD